MIVTTACGGAVGMALVAVSAIAYTWWTSRRSAAMFDEPRSTTRTARTCDSAGNIVTNADESTEDVPEVMAVDDNPRQNEHRDDNMKEMTTPSKRRPAAITTGSDSSFTLLASPAKTPARQRNRRLLSATSTATPLRPSSAPACPPSRSPTSSTTTTTTTGESSSTLLASPANTAVRQRPFSATPSPTPPRPATQAISTTTVSTSTSTPSSPASSPATSIPLPPSSPTTTTPSPRIDPASSSFISTFDSADPPVYFQPINKEQVLAMMPFWTKVGNGVAWRSSHPMNALFKAGSMTVLAQSAEVMLRAKVGTEGIGRYQQFEITHEEHNQMNNLILDAPAKIRELLNYSKSAEEAGAHEEARRLGWAARQLLMSCQAVSNWMPSLPFGDCFDTPTVGTVQFIPHFAFVANGLAHEQAIKNHLVVAQVKDNFEKPLPVILLNALPAQFNKDMPEDMRIPLSMPSASAAQTAAFLKNFLPQATVSVETRGPAYAPSNAASFFQGFCPNATVQVATAPAQAPSSHFNTAPTAAGEFSAAEVAAFSKNR